jgi:hypothetical protein
MQVSDRVPYESETDTLQTAWYVLFITVFQVICLLAFSGPDRIFWNLWIYLDSW